MVNKKLVLMRKEDFFIDATQIIALANKESGERQKILLLLKEKTEAKIDSPEVPLHSRYSWINFYFASSLQTPWARTENAAAPELRAEVETWVRLRRPATNLRVFYRNGTAC